MSRPPLVLIVWEDAAVMDSGPWASNEATTYTPRLFEQVGFLLCDEPAGVILTHAWSAETVAAREQIPRGMIRSMTVLKAQRKAKQ